MFWMSVPLESGERVGDSWTSKPIPWPRLWRNCFPYPAFFMMSRETLSTEAQSAPGVIFVMALVCASRTVV